MARTKLNIIVPSLSFMQLADPELLQRINAVLDGTYANPKAYPTPPVDLATFTATRDAFTSAAAAAVDGGKAQIVARDKYRAQAIVQLRQLGHYVETACMNDMQTFVSSGFVAASKTRTPASPVAQSAVVSVDPGNTGQLLVTVKRVANALHYVISYAAVPAAGATATETTVIATGTRPATAIDNLNPGTIYTFRVRAFGKLGYSDWSDSANKMCT